MLRNVHAELLDAMQLTVDAAWDVAIGNFRQNLLGREDGIHQVVLEAPNNCKWAIWGGKDIASSCVMLPEFFEKCRKLLQDDTFLVCIASTELVFVIMAKHSASLADFDHYIQHITKNSRSLVSSAWFTLTASGFQLFSNSKKNTFQQANAEQPSVDALYDDDDSHAIPYLEEIDLFGAKKSGGADLAIVISSPLTADQRSKQRLCRKVQNYLDYIASDSFLVEVGRQNICNTNIIVYLHSQSDPQIITLLKQLESFVNDQDVKLSIAPLPKSTPQ